MKSFSRFVIFAVLGPVVGIASLVALAGFASLIRHQDPAATERWLYDTAQVASPLIWFLFLVACAIPALIAAALSRVMWSGRPLWLRTAAGIGAVLLVAPFALLLVVTEPAPITVAGGLASSLMTLAVCDRISRWIERRPSRSEIAQTFA